MRSKLLFLAIVMMILLAMGVQGAVIFSDNFDRADSGTVGGDWLVEGANWEIANNTLYSPATSQDFMAVNTSAVAGGTFYISYKIRFKSASSIGVHKTCGTYAYCSGAGDQRMSGEWSSSVWKNYDSAWRTWKKRIAGTWENITMKMQDATNNFVAYNDTQEAQQVGAFNYRGGGNTISYHFATNSGAGTHNIWIDDFCVYTALGDYENNCFTAPNSAPVLAGPDFNVSVVRTMNDVFCNSTVTDADSDPTNITAFGYVDGVQVKNQSWTGVASGTNNVFYLNYTMYGMDNVINCTFTATDGTDTDKVSATLTVLNTPPVMSSVRLWSSTNTTASNILGYATFTDDDLHNASLDYNIYKNGAIYYQLNFSSIQAQETSDSFWQNGLWSSNPTVNWTKLLDNNYATYSTGEFPGYENISIFIVNYTIPDFADQNSSRWEVKVGNVSAGTPTRLLNYSIPISCWDTSVSLEVRLWAIGGAGYYSDIFCHNSTSRILLANFTDVGSVSNYYDEKMYWDLNPSYTSGIEYNLLNISSASLSEGDVWVLEVRSLDTPGNYSSWLNSSALSILDFPGFILNYPEDNTSYNNDHADYTYTGFINLTTDINASVVLNDTRWNVTTSNGTFHTFYYSGFASLSDGQYSFTATGTGSDGAVNSTSFSFWIDTNPPNQVNNLNNGVGLSSLAFQVNFTDDVILYSINFSGLDYNYYKSGINASSYSHNATLNLVNHSIGEHNLSLQFCDGHTKKEIGLFDYEKNSVSKELKFEFGDNWLSVRPLNPDSFVSFDTTKKVDRYTFDYEKTSDKKDKDETFVVVSSHPIDIVQSDKYTGWLVIPGLKKWIDFESDGGHKAKVKRISAYEVEVTTKGEYFESVGSLNCNNATFTYYRIDHSVIFNSNVAEGNNEAYVVVINRTGVPITARNGTLIYNLTDSVGLNNYTLTTDYLNLTFQRITNYTDNDNMTYTFQINFSINNNEFNTSTYTQIVFNFGLSNCSSGSDNLVYNVSIFNEQDLVPLVSNLKGTFYFWGENDSVQTNLTLNLNGASTYYLCTLNNLSTTIDVYLQNIVSYTHRYYLFSDVVTPGTPRYIDLYNFNTTSGISQLEGTSRREVNYQYYPNVIGSLLRYYPELNVWRTVQMDRSGDFGLLAYDIIEKSVDYRFIFRDTNNTVLDTSNSLKFVCSSGVCSLTFLLNPAGSSTASDDLTVSATYNNITGIINVTWSDPEGDTRNVITNVSREKLGGSLQICGIRQTGSAGSTTCNVSGYDGQFMVSVRTENSPIYAQFVAYFYNARTWITNYMSSIDSTLITGAIMVISILSSLFSPVGAVISSMAGLILVFMLGLFTPFTFTFIMIACAMGVALGLIIKK